MFNIGFTEMLVIAGLALILIGPKQLPEVARSLGRMLNEFKRSADILKDEFKSQLSDTNLKDFGRLSQHDEPQQEQQPVVNSSIEQQKSQPDSQHEKKTDDDGSNV